MRTPDDLNLERFQPLGQKVTPQAPPAAAPAQRVAPGIMRRPDGRLYTDLPLPKDKP